MATTPTNIVIPLANDETLHSVFSFDFDTHSRLLSSAALYGRFVLNRLIRARGKLSQSGLHDAFLLICFAFPLPSSHKDFGDDEMILLYEWWSVNRKLAAVTAAAISQTPRFSPGQFPWEYALQHKKPFTILRNLTRMDEELWIEGDFRYLMVFAHVH